MVIVRYGVLMESDIGHNPGSGAEESKEGKAQRLAADRAEKLKGMIEAGASIAEMCKATGSTPVLVKAIRDQHLGAAELGSRAEELRNRFGIDLIGKMQADPVAAIVQTSLMACLLAEDNKTRMEGLRLLARISPNKCREAVEALTEGRERVGGGAGVGGEDEDDADDWRQDAEIDMVRLGLD